MKKKSKPRTRKNIYATFVGIAPETLKELNRISAKKKLSRVATVKMLVLAGKRG